MAKKKKPNENEELELDQAFFDLTGYPQGKKKNSPFAFIITFICFLVLGLAGLMVGVPFLLKDDPVPTAPPVTTPPVTEPTAITDSAGTDTEIRMPENTFVFGIDLSQMTHKEAAEALETILETDMTIILNGEQYPVHTGDLITSFDAQGAAAALLDAPDQFSPSDWLVPNTDAIRTLADTYAAMFRQDDIPTDYSVLGEMPTLESIDTEPECQTLVITKGSPGTVLDSETLYQVILDGLSNGIFTVEAYVSVDSTDPFDLDSLFETLCVAPEDAVMDMDTFVVTGGKYGYEFDLEQARLLLDAAESGAVIEIPFYRTEPAVTAQSLQSLLFRDVLSSASTPHTDNYNRNNNLTLACQAINGIILYPGEEFSYNAALGQRTREKGYLPAGSFMGEETVDTVGGGICQVSSTLYYCTLLADLQVTYRAYHGFTVSYLPLGMDAMVSWGSYDYCFRNDSNYPLRIEAWVADGYVHIQLIGTDLRDYYVEMENEVEAVYPHETVYRELPADNQYGYKDGDVIVTPYTGYMVHTYRCLYDRQTKELIGRYYEDYSDYWSRNEVIAKIVTG